MHFGLKIRGIDTKTKNKKLIRGGKVRIKSCWTWFNEKLRQKDVFYDVICKIISQNKGYSSDFIIIKKNWNSNLNHFLQLLFCIFPPPMNLIFFYYLSANTSYFQTNMHVAKCHLI